MSTMRAALICSVAFLALQASLVAQVRAKPLLRAADVKRPNVLTDAEKKQGFKLLFDGETAAGWSSWKTKKPLKLDKWTVWAETLTLSKGGGDIYTTETYENFELKQDWNLDTSFTLAYADRDQAAARALGLPRLKHSVATRAVRSYLRRGGASPPGFVSGRLSRVHPILSYIPSGVSEHKPERPPPSARGGPIRTHSAPFAGGGCAHKRIRRRRASAVLAVRSAPALLHSGSGHLQ